MVLIGIFGRRFGFCRVAGQRCMSTAYLQNISPTVRGHDPPCCGAYVEALNQSANSLTRSFNSPQHPESKL